MDAHSNIADAASTVQKRTQRFLHFKLQPGDEALLEQLTDSQRELLLTDGTYQEKSQRLGIPIGTVRSRTHRARAMIEMLRQEQIGSGTVKNIEPH